MKEVLIDFDNKGPININETVNIAAFKSNSEDIEYKFMEGLEGIWKSIQDFSPNNICRWNPTKPGKYMIMVQGKSTDCKNGYDYLGRAEYEVISNKESEEKIKLINNISVDNNIVTLGEKALINIESDEEVLLCRFKIKNNDEWEILKDYSTEKQYIYTANESGIKEILIECKSINSERNVDEFKTVTIEVKDINKVEIKDIKCSCASMIVDEELSFKIDSTYTDNRPLLYKFLKVNKQGKMTCIQDFSSNNGVVFKEKEAGEYKLLCLVRDMFSNKAFDDRALISYTIKPYNKVKINSFKSDITSPQGIGNTINFNTIASGGKTLVYRYIIDGPIKDDTGYRRDSEFSWVPQIEGDYSITVKVRDISSNKDYEDISINNYKIYKKSEKPLRITEIISNKRKKCIIGENINLVAKVEGGNKALYSFIVYKNGIKDSKVDYGVSNWIDYVPEEKGEYEIEVRVRDYYSIREYDCSTSLHFKVNDYIPAQIECLIHNTKERYLIDDTIDIEAIVTDTNNTLINLITKINGQEVESTGFVENKKFRIKPKCQGKYTFKILAKNIKSLEEYDSKKELNIYVHDVTPVTDTKVCISKDDIKIGEEITFNATSYGGREVCYQFYIMNNGNWALVQKYSRKNYYTFVPFIDGEYRILVLSKSFHKKSEYEDYDIIDFNVQKL